MVQISRVELRNILISICMTALRSNPKGSKSKTDEAPPKSGDRLLTVRPDTLDFRILTYVPTLVKVPQQRPLESYQLHGPEVLDEGQEGTKSVSAGNRCAPRFLVASWFEPRL